MKLNELQTNPGSRHNRKRKGRGAGSGNGKDAGRGENGQNSRSGGGTYVGFEGGQLPLYRRLPKRGFSNARFKKEYNIVNLDQLNVFADGTKVTPTLLVEKKIVKQELTGIKILGNGTLTKTLSIQAHKFSKSAITSIEKNKGSVEVI